MDTENGKRDRRSLPLGLRRYRPGVFEKLHSAGSGVVTASQISALFGVNPWQGAYALACHIAGRGEAVEVTETDHMKWGRLLEAPVVGEVAREKDWAVDQVRAYAPHPQFDRLIASPDAVAWRNGPGVVPELTARAGIGEVKVVMDRVFERDWQDEPPVHVQLQHQCQFACTGASWGFIAVLVLGYRRELRIFETAPNPAAMAMILDAAKDLFALLDKGLLPPPDDHPASIEALHRIYPATDPGKIVTLTGPEAEKRFTAWEQAKLDRLAAEKIEDAAKGWFSMQDPQAGEFRIGNDKAVTVKVVKRKETVIPAYSYRKWDLKQEKVDD